MLRSGCQIFMRSCLASLAQSVVKPATSDMDAFQAQLTAPEHGRIDRRHIMDAVRSSHTRRVPLLKDPRRLGAVHPHGLLRWVWLRRHESPGRAKAS